MWLTVSYCTTEPEWPVRLENIKVAITSGNSFPINRNYSFRVSPIFPLTRGSDIPELSNSKLKFYHFKNPYRVLGRVNKKSKKIVRLCTWYTLGLNSIVVISSNQVVFDEFEAKAGERINAWEFWELDDQNNLVRCKYSNPQSVDYDLSKFRITNYDVLPLDERVVLDEFCINVEIILPRVSRYIPDELKSIERLVSKMNVLTKELVYLVELGDYQPETLSEYTKSQLTKNVELRESIRQQNLDRLIQVNAALTYVSTQTFSGSIPILERRSLIRRHSLLGVGAAILGMNSIARHIELAFSILDLTDIFENRLPKEASLPGLDSMPAFYTSDNWSVSSLNKWERPPSTENSFPKLPYFSGRLGFRESEFTISAALQSLSAGGGLEWSIMTLTHEMVHGHVRNLLSLLFQVKAIDNPTKKWKSIFDIFDEFRRKSKSSDYSLIDSLRNVILTYVSYSKTFGSITNIYNQPRREKIRKKFPFLNKEKLKRQFELENRNINEIIVHVLDLRYFYVSRVNTYIPLIWRSWAVLPHVKSDLDQYILRSLLTISSVRLGSESERFNQSCSDLIQILEGKIGSIRNEALINRVIEKLQNDQTRDDYLLPFINSLKLVDLASEVFFSEKIKERLFKDNSFYLDNTEEYEDEDSIMYDIDNGFQDQAIESPTAYILSLMNKNIMNEDEPELLEELSFAMFLAINSK